MRPDQATPLIERGWLYILADAPLLAKHDFEAALRLDPSSADAYNGRGSARLALASTTKPLSTPRRRSPSASRTRNSSTAPRVYAFAAVVVAAEIAKNGRESLILKAHYQERAVTLLLEAIKQTPDAQRAGFVRDVIETDPALRVLRRRVWSQELSSAADSKKSSVSARCSRRGSRSRQGWEFVPVDSLMDPQS